MSKLGLKNLVENTAKILGRQFIAGIIQLVAFIIIARTFGPEGNGQYAVALLMPVLLLTLLNLGISPSNIYHLGAEKVSLLTVVKISLMFWILISVLGLVIGASVISFAGQIFFPGIDEGLLWLSLLVFPLILLERYLLSIFQGKQRFDVYNLVLIIQPVITLSLIVAFLLTGFKDIKYVVVAYIFGVLSTVVLSIFYIVSFLRKEESNQDSVQYFRAAMQYGFKSSLSNILAYINYKADIFLVNFLIGTSAAGAYVVAVQLVEKLWLLSHAVSAVLFPRLSQLHSDDESRKALTPVVCRWVFILTLAGCVLLGAIAYPLIHILFGDQYSNAVVPLLLLLPGILASSGARIIANDIAARGRPELNTYTAWVVVIVNITGNIILIPVYGLAGAAIATSIAYIINLVLRLMIYKYFSGNKWTESLLVKSEDLQTIKLIGRK